MEEHIEFNSKTPVSAEYFLLADIFDLFEDDFVTGFYLPY